MLAWLSRYANITRRMSRAFLYFVYHKNTPMGDELKWLLKEGGGHIFESSFENTPNSHAFSPAACTDSAMLLLACVCLCNNTKWCLPSFLVPPLNSAASLVLLA